MTEIAGRNHLSNLIVIAMADGVLNDLEKEFISEKAALMDISRDELNELFNKAEDLKISASTDAKTKEEQLADAMLMVVIDGKIHENETACLRELGRILNFSEDHIERILQKSYYLWNQQP